MNTTYLRTRTGITLLLATFIALSGCAGMSPGYENPTVTVQSFKPIASSDGSGLPRFEIVLNVINPNIEPLELAGVSYTISLDGNDLIKGVGNELPVIEGYGEGSFTLTAGVNLLAGIGLFRSILNKEGDSFDYAFEAKLDPGALRPSIRVKDSGEVSLSGGRGSE